MEGKLEEIEDELFCRHYLTFKKIKLDYQKQPENLPPGTIVGYWYWGEPGTGKSHQARLDYPGAYLKSAQNKWWDDYKGEEYVIIEDFDVSQSYMGMYFKQWVDVYVVRAEVKYGSMIIRPKKIIVTSNWRMDQIWTDEKVLQPLLRRFHQHHFTEKIDVSLMPKPEIKERVADCILEKRFDMIFERNIVQDLDLDDCATW